MLKDVADEEDAVDSGPAAGLVHLHSLLPEAGPAVGRAAGARSARGIPVLRMTLERPRRVLRARFGQIRDGLEQLGGSRTAQALEERHDHTEERREHQQAPQRVDEDPVLVGDLVGEENADFRLEVEDAGDTDAGANDAQADQMVPEVTLRQVDSVLAAADRRQHRN